MNRRFKYRVKTLEEFQIKFGVNWRDVRGTFINRMDYLLGTDIDYKLYFRYLDNNGDLIPDSRFMIKGENNNWENNNWELTNEMLIKVSTRGMYQPRQFIYE